MVQYSVFALGCMVVVMSANTEADSPPEESRNDVVLLEDFGPQSPEWRCINDSVMGGVSSSRFRIEDGLAVFQGAVSLDNNGGFASARSQPREYGLSNSHILQLRVRGDGRRYAFRLRTTAAFDGISYQARFDTKAGKWTVVDFSLEAFEPVFRGRRVRKADPLDLKSVKTFGVLISDKQVGPFRLEIDWIKARVAESEEPER